MNDLIINILRGSVSAVMNIILFFTMTKSRFGHKATILVASSVFLINIVSTFWFYLYGDLTSLSRFNVILFILVGISLKPLTKLSFMQWCFTFLTIINISMMIIILSFHMSRKLPMPYYAHTLIRLLLYILVIIVFKRFLLPIYQSIVDNWPVFSALVICISLNLAYYFFVTDDIQNSLIIYRWPLFLLIALSIAAYGTVFYSLKKFTIINALETENQKFQQETGLLYQETMKLEKYANYDTLTGLPNRRFFFDKLEKLVAESAKNARKMAILYIDLDAFKDINDTFGHQVGDSVLITVGNRLLKCKREADFVARLGGDEFAVLVQDVKDIATVEKLTEGIHAVLQEKMIINSIEYTIDTSIGIALYPDSGKDGESLLKNADSAMYEIKRHGKGGVGIFTVQEG